MNNKTYANYLMHGRTKGSRNGISTTKGYTAVGQKAKGKLINGKYVYDVSYLTSYGKLKNAGVNDAVKSIDNGIKNNWQQQSNYARAGGEAVNHAVSGQTSRVHMKLNSAQENQAIAGMTAKARRDLSKAGATKGDAQQAALEQWKKQNQNAIAAKKKKVEAFDKASDAYMLGLSYPVDQMANRTRTVNEHYNKNWKNNTTINYDAPGTGSYLDAKKAKDAAYLRGKNAVNKATMNGANTNASQQAELERWKQQNRNNIAAKKTADAKAQAAKDAAWNAKVQTAKQPTNIGASQAGNTARAMKEYMTKASADRKAKAQAVKDNATQMGLRNKVKAGAANNWQQQASERAALGQQRIRNENGTSGQNSFYNKNSVVKNHRFVDETPRDASGNVRVTYKPKADNTSNNWQQNANKTAGILGNMSREDRSLMKSKEWTSTDKDGTKKTNNSFNVNNKYGYSNYIKSDNGWHDIHMGEYNTTGVKGVKKQQDWNTSYERNHRSDIGNAVADAKAGAKKAFKEAKADAKQAYVNLKNKFKKKKKK